MPFIVMIPMINAVGNMKDHLLGKRQVGATKCEENTVAIPSAGADLNPADTEVHKIINRRQTTKKVVPTMAAGGHVGGMETMRYNRPAAREVGYTDTVYEHVTDVDTRDHMQSIKTERLSAKHLATDCGVERELMQACVKDRYYQGGAGYKGMTCDDHLAKYRQCIRNTSA